jgi:signal transduction histidine kinase
MVELRLLKASHPDEKQTHSLQVLERNFNRIVGLVREMLDVARLEAGRMAIRSERVDLGAVVAGVVGDFADVARARGITLASGAMDIQIVGDGRRVAQILGHLLDNAVRLTPQGGSVTVDVDRSEERARIRVTDTGVGLTEKQIEALFDAFSAVHDEPLAGAGPGMGLYIARGLVKEMGGEIGVTSRGPGHGATFVIHLPLASPVDGPPAGAGPGVAE